MKKDLDSLPNGGSRDRRPVRERCEIPGNFLNTTAVFLTVGAISMTSETTSRRSRLSIRVEESAERPIISGREPEGLLRVTRPGKFRRAMRSNGSSCPRSPHD